jgi:hypothetical protein
MPFLSAESGPRKQTAEFISQAPVIVDDFFYPPDFQRIPQCSISLFLELNQIINALLGL